jgi:uncharacterized membrane protein YbhN (UPF0104 family)
LALTLSQSLTLGRRSAVAAAAVVAAVLVLVVAHRGTLAAGQQVLTAADRDWLSVGLAASAMTWVAGTLSQLGSSATRLPVGRLFAVQVAGSFLNHLLPAGLGAMAVNVRFLQRSGMTRPAALAAIGLNASATVVTHVLLLAGAVAVAPSLLVDARPVVGPGAFAEVLGSAAVVAVLVLVLGTGLWLGWVRRAGRGWAATVARRTRETVGGARREIRRLGLVLRDPVRAVELWLGASASPLLHAVTLLAVLRAVGNPVPMVSVLAVYLVMSAVAALVPSPGGLGALDVLLVGGLVAVGTPVVTAVAAVLGYRLLTVWVPLLPAAAVFAGLVRRRVI